MALQLSRTLLKEYNLVGCVLTVEMWRLEKAVSHTGRDYSATPSADVDHVI